MAERRGGIGDDKSWKEVGKWRKEGKMEEGRGRGREVEGGKGKGGGMGKRKGKGGE